MKARRFTLCMLIVGLALVLAGAAAAQSTPEGGGRNDHRAQAFASGVVGWGQANLDGFGDPG